MCDRWANSFSNFYEDMGEVPFGLEIDRIDNNKGYSKDNCRWVTAKINCRNRRSTRRITHQGETLSLVEWGEKTGICAHTIRLRIDRYHWTIDKALSQSAKAHK